MRRFLILVSLFLLLQFLQSNILISDDLYFKAYNDKLTYERIADAISQGKKLKWLTYVLIPFILLIKIYFVVVCLSIGGFVRNLEVNFKTYFSVVATAEFLFLVPFIFKLLWFSIVNPSYTLQDLQFFHPLSVLSLFDQSEIEPWLLYPFQLLNLFELLYWIVLGLLLKPILSEGFRASMKFVIQTYGVGLFIWVVFVMFLTISVS